jgi:hypothetical protein
LAAANSASERFGRELPSAIDAVARGPSALNFGAVPFFFCLTTVGERSSHFAFDAAATSAGEGEGGDAFGSRFLSSDDDDDDDDDGNDDDDSEGRSIQANVGVEFKGVSCS